MDLPKLFSIGGYVIFFWSDENNEPVHVHVSRGKISPNTTKLWLTKDGGCIVARKSRIPAADIKKIMSIVTDNHDYICKRWKSYFDILKLKFYC
jgi:hypothetical protein